MTDPQHPTRLATVALWFAARAQGTLTIASLAAISIGAGMERPSLGLLVPGGIIFSLLVYGRLRGGPQ